MAPSDKAHGRTHSLLLLQKLLNLRDGASPLTLVIDSLEQPAWPLISELTSRAKVTKSKTILVSFSTVRKPAGIDVVIPAYSLRDLSLLRKTLFSHAPSTTPTSTSTSTPTSTLTSTSTSTTTTTTASRRRQKTLIIIDSLNMLLASHPVNLASFLPSLLPGPHASLLAIYHGDVPAFGASTDPRHHDEYAPSPLSLMRHLATAVVQVSSLAHEIARQEARGRSLPEPDFGLGERREGVLVGLRRPDEADEVRRGVALEADIRRRSGRSVVEKFVVIRPPEGEGGGVGRLCLLADYGIFAQRGDGRAAGNDDGPTSTFDLGLTDKQRRDRAGVVLPYFDAQTEIGGGDGGRILYDMGREDDFDDEEDEI